MNVTRLILSDFVIVDGVRTYNVIKYIRCCNTKISEIYFLFLLPMTSPGIFTP